MARGGNREGAGRPKGAINKRTAELMAQVDASGCSPVQFMLQIMNDTVADKAMRLDAAKACAPFIHARRSAVEVTAGASEPVDIEQVNAKIRSLLETDPGLRKIAQEALAKNVAD